MTMKYDANWVREQVLAADAYRLDHHACGICGEQVGYDFMFGEDVRFNANCGCTKYWTEPRASSYEEISEWLLGQYNDGTRDLIMARIKRRAKPVVDLTLPEGTLAFRETGVVGNFTLQGSGDKPLLVIHHDGTVEGDLDKASEAAQAFVDAVTTMWPAALNKAKADEQQALCTYLERLIEVARTNSNTEIVFPLQLILHDINAERHHDA